MLSIFEVSAVEVGKNCRNLALYTNYSTWAFDAKQKNCNPNMFVCCVKQDNVLSNNARSYGHLELGKKEKNKDMDIKNID
jgi:hypothetical protein